MMLSSLTMMILLLSIIFYLSTNPLSMGITVLFIALSSTFLISLLMSSWICFLVFLIYIGGMLVLFSYFVAITPNIPMPSLSIVVGMAGVAPLMMLMMYVNPSFNQIGAQSELFIPFMYTKLNMLILLMLATILLLTMIIIVKLISMKSGPLRPFNYV